MVGKLLSFLWFLLIVTCFSLLFTSQALAVYTPKTVSKLVADSDYRNPSSTGRMPLILIHGVHGTDSSTFSSLNGTTGKDYFNSFIDYFYSSDLKDKYQLFRFHYLSDQLSVKDIAQGLQEWLDDFIANRVIPDGQFIILSHSMGGLVARSFMQEQKHAKGAFANQYGGERVDKLITLATPHHGSPGANGASRNALASDSVHWLSVIELASIFYNAKYSLATAISDAAVNRSDLRTDSYAFDNYSLVMNDNPWLTQLNQDVSYDSKIIAYYGSVNYDDPERTAIYNDALNYGPEYLLTYAPSQGLHQQLLVANILMNEGMGAHFSFNDGMVPEESAKFDGHAIAKAVQLNNYEHLQMRDGKTYSTELFDLIKADLSDVYTTSNPNTIIAAEYFIDSDPGEGNGIALTAKDGVFDSILEDVEISLDTSNLAMGVHTLYIRMQNSEKVWGIPRKIMFDVAGKKYVAGAEYFIDTDPGGGQGIPIAPSDGLFNQTKETLDFDVDTSDLSPGLHTLYVRTKDSENHWGLPRQYTFEVQALPTMAAAEYYIDTDPGRGSGTSLIAADGNFNSSSETIQGSVVTTNLSYGNHILYVRSMDSYGRWGDSEPVNFLVGPLLTLTKAGTGTGTITSQDDPQGINCGNDCTEVYNNQTVTLTAVAAAASTFISWSGCTSTTGNLCTVSLTADKTVTATFNDITPPETTINIKPATFSNTLSPSFSFTANEAISAFQCQLDGGGYATCTSPKSYTTLTEGSHTFAIKATDAAGNTAITPTTYTWTVDVTPPDTTIGSKPVSISNNNSASFSFTSTEDSSTFECKIDSGDYLLCQSPKIYPELADGSHAFYVKATDVAGNTDSTPVSYTWKVDTIAPDTTLASKPTNPSNSNTSSFGFDSTEIGSTFLCQLDNGNYTACSSPIAFSSLADGTHTFSVKATDLAGNTDSTPASYTWAVDTVPPDTSISSKPNNLTNSSTSIFNFTSTESGGYFQCQLDGGNYSLCVSPKEYQGLTDGSHTFFVKATDAAGNTDLTPASYTWTVDTIPPDTTIGNKPNNPTNSNTASLGFESTENGSTFLCQFDSGNYTACTSPGTYSGLSDGPHTFSVEATDQTGNIDPTPASYTWVVDTMPPDTTIGNKPNYQSNSSVATFTFEATEIGSTFQCQLDGANFAACTSPKEYTGLADGSHTFFVKATDPAGNTDPTPANYAWIVDTIVPDTSITSKPNNPSKNSSAIFIFDATESGATFQCQIDGASYTDCTSPMNYSILTDGSHTFSVKATDLAGNTDASPTSYTWAIDTIAPDTSITGKPNNFSKNNTAIFTFEATESGVTFQCQLDGGNYAGCTSPKEYPGLTDGSHTFYVKATDGAGNTDATPASYSWTIDTIAPDTSISSKPSNPANSGTVIFAFESTESGSTFQCQLDNGNYAACTNPMTYPGLNDGIHSFAVKASDLAGNTDATPASYSWTVDTIAPDSSISSQPNKLSNSNSATFTFEGTETGVNFKCQIDGGNFTECTSPKEYTGLADGSHVFYVKATDAAGNTDPTPASYTWVIDTVAPDTVLKNKPNNPTNNSLVSFSFESTKDGSTFQCQLDNSAYAACTSPAQYSNLADGTHTFSVKAKDPAGNADATPVSYTWVVDTAAPDTVISSKPGSLTNNSRAVFTFEATESGATFQCQLDGGNYAICVSPKEYSGLADGSHTFYVKATDVAGNTDLTSAIYTWLIDTITPDTTITSKPSNPSNHATAIVTFEATKNGATFQCQFDSDDYTTCTSPITLTNLTDGSHTFSVKATDPVGNTDTTPASYTWMVDTSTPDTIMISSPYNPSNSSTAKFLFEATKIGSNFQCQLDSANYSSCTNPKEYTGLADGSHTFYVKATDTSGNTDPTPVSYTWTVDTSAPETLVGNKPDDPSSNNMAIFTFESTESGSTFECQLDSGNFAVCESPLTYSELTEGAHAFAVRATDKAGNTDLTSATYSWRVDTKAPGTSISSKPNNPSNKTTVSFTFETKESGATFYCKLDEGNYLSCVSPLEYTGLLDGNHTFYLKATDKAGNTDSVAISYNWQIDTTLPASTIMAPVNKSIIIGTTLTLEGKAFDSGTPIQKVEISTDGGSTWGLASGTTSWTYEWPIPGDGSYAIISRAVDSAGNIETPSAAITVTTYKRQPSLVVIDERRLFVNGQPFTIKGVDYFPTPIGDDPELIPPYGDYFTPEKSSIYRRDLPLLRNLGSNTISVLNWDIQSNHLQFLDEAYNGGKEPLYIVLGFSVQPEQNIDPNSPDNVREELKSAFRDMVSVYKNHPAILMWSIGKELNSQMMYGSTKDNLFSLINEMAAVAHLEEGPDYHPITVDLSGDDLIQTIATYDALLPSLDVWGVNVYKGMTFGNLFIDYREASQKPIVVLGYGIDAYDNSKGDEYEYLGRPYQAEYAVALWQDIAGNSEVCLGGIIKSYLDEWWRGKNFYSDGCHDSDSNYQSTCGYVNSSQPDGYSNEEWRGIMRVKKDSSDTDALEPRSVYYTLQTLWSEVIKVDPPLIDFGKKGIGKSSLSKVITISNISKEELVMGAITPVGTNIPAFIIKQDNCSAKTLLSSEVCAIEMAFSPYVKDLNTAYLTIHLVDGGEIPMLNLPLSGIGLFKVDINNDGNVDLQDAILASQILTCPQNSSVIPACESVFNIEIDEDNKIGLRELIYILQKKGGIR